MNDPAQQYQRWIFLGVVLLFINACLLIWIAIIQRWLSGRPVLSYQPRRPVPWCVWDLLAIVFFYYGGIVCFVVLVDFWLPQFSLGPPLPFEIQKTSTAHPLVQLLAMKNWTAIVLSCVAGIVVAPIVEELFFRVLLQGWLEKVDRRWRRRWPMLRRIMPLALMPILISSFVFASQHFREASPPEDVQYLLVLMAGNGMVSLFALIFAVAWLHQRTGATAADLGWQPKKFFVDLRTGIIASIAVIVPVFLGQYLLSQLLPEQYAPDPLSLFFLAVLLGFIFFRTHRVLPLIVVHTALNATSLLIIVLS